MKDDQFKILVLRLLLTILDSHRTVDPLDLPWSQREVARDALEYIREKRKHLEEDCYL